MADRDENTDIEKLLADVESTLGGRPPSPRARNADQPAERAAAGFTARVSAAAVSGAVAAALVWVAFLFLPFLGATSGAAGAFLAAFVSVLLLRRR
jgi:hypothetical protein